MGTTVAATAATAANAASLTTALLVEAAALQGAVDLDVLDSRNLIYLRKQSLWFQQENRIRGGEYVLDELVPFDWEKNSILPSTSNRSQERSLQAAAEIALAQQMLSPNQQSHYVQRQNQATYLNFPDMYATVMAGHLMKAAPKPGAGLSFGALGDVNPRNAKRSAGATASQAELIYYNADGIGNDGSLWDNFWMGAMRRAMATGHRWIMVDAPAQAPQSRADEAAGLRPYLVEYSPLNVTNWHFERGRLAFAILRIAPDRPYFDDEAETAPGTRDDYLLLVRQGYEGIAPYFAKGGWWRFDFERTLLDFGDWAKTQGQIPMGPLFYQRDHGTRGYPELSRGGLTELSQCAVSYMNLASAADFDAWDAAMSIEWLQGVDTEGFNLAMAKLKEGSRYVPLPVNADTDVVPTVKDSSAGAVVAEVFNTRLQTKRTEAKELASMEATSAPDSSGVAKVAGFGQAMSPRLALMASELEAAQNTALYFLELRFGAVAPAASVSWTRDFELLEVVQHIEAFFSLERLSGLRSPTLDAQLMITAAKEKGLLSDEATEVKARAEFQAAAATRLAYSAAERTLLDDVDNADGE